MVQASCTPLGDASLCNSGRIYEGPKRYFNMSVVRLQHLKIKRQDSKWLQGGVQDKYIQLNILNSCMINVESSST